MKVHNDEKVAKESSVDQHPFQCGECPKRCKGERALKIHKTTKHGVPNELREAKCPLCNRTFSSVTHARGHLTIKANGRTSCDKNMSHPLSCGLRHMQGPSTKARQKRVREERGLGWGIDILGDQVGHPTKARKYVPLIFECTIPSCKRSGKLLNRIPQVNTKKSKVIGVVAIR